ncbi:lipopolysaccharide transport periplasmic protein LptA [Aquicoccus sp. SCR17]|nr:lipopolysaccharide transport periplasmic protein LptA [Carideicomes alvinocaridis]
MKPFANALFAVLLSFAIAILAAPLHAQGAQVNFGGLQQDTDAPVEITAEELSINQSDGTAVFTGDVLIVQGEMRLQAAKVLVVYKEGSQSISRLEATGGVTLVSGTEAAEAERADYDIDAGTVHMQGDVLLTQGQSALSSQEMVVDLNDGTANMTGRVRTVLQGSGD